MSSESIEIKKLRIILSKPSALRTNVEIQNLLLALQDIEFFRKLDRDIARATCQNLTYEHLLEGDLVFEQGEPGDAFYVILEGSVGVYVDDRLIEAAETEKVVINPLKYITKAYKFAKKEDRRPTASVTPTAFVSNPLAAESSSKSRKLGRAHTMGSVGASNDLRQVATLSKGQAFGEMALQTDQPRTATVRALNNLHLAKLDRSDYLRVIKSHYDKQTIEIYSFLRKVSLFSDWPDLKLQKLAPMFVIKRLIRGQNVVNEGESVNEISFLKEGEFQVNRLFNNKQDTVSIISPPSSLGLDEYVLAVDRFPYSVTCSSSHGLVLAIPSSKLTSRIAPEARDSLLLAARQNAEFRAKRAHILDAVHAPRKMSQASGNGVVTESQQEWLRRLETLVDTLKSEYSVPGRLGAILEAEGKPGVDVFKFLASNSDSDVPLVASPRATAILLHEGRLPDQNELNL
jgi:CRP-like cAMP-binding protein